MTGIHYSIHGRGLPVVFQHGLGAESSQIISLLSPIRDCRLLTCDSGGHGKSPMPAHGVVSFNQYADEVIRIMDAENISKAVIGGLSMGAGIAVNISVRYPERVLAMILHRRAWRLQPEPDNLLILLKAAEMIRNGSGPESLQQDTDFQTLFGKLPMAAESVLQLFEKPDPDNLSNVLEMMVRDCPLPSVPEIRKPALIIGNENDPLHPISIARYWHDTIPGSKLEIVTSRYLDNVRHGNQVAEAINDFLTQFKTEHS